MTAECMIDQVRKYHSMRHDLDSWHTLGIAKGIYKGREKIARRQIRMKIHVDVLVAIRYVPLGGSSPGFVVLLSHRPQHIKGTEGESHSTMA